MSRLTLCFALVVLSACAPEPGEYCATVLEENDGCLSATAAEDCEAAYEQCPGRVLIQESCPIQFACP